MLSISRSLFDHLRPRRPFPSVGAASPSIRARARTRLFVARPPCHEFSLLPSRSVRPFSPALDCQACKGTWFLRQCKTVSRPSPRPRQCRRRRYPFVRGPSRVLLHSPPRRTKHVRKNDAPRARCPRGGCVKLGGSEMA